MCLINCSIFLSHQSVCNPHRAHKQGLALSDTWTEKFGMSMMERKKQEQRRIFRSCQAWPRDRMPRWVGMLRRWSLGRRATHLSVSSSRVLGRDFGSCLPGEGKVIWCLSSCFCGWVQWRPPMTAMWGVSMHGLILLNRGITRKGVIHHPMATLNANMSQEPTTGMDNFLGSLLVFQILYCGHLESISYMNSEGNPS